MWDKVKKTTKVITLCPSQAKKNLTLLINVINRGNALFKLFQPTLEN